MQIFKDQAERRLALIQCPRQGLGTELTVDAFSFTSLLPSASKLLLNVEMDDHGIIEKRTCGCPLERYGLTQHLARSEASAN